MAQRCLLHISKLADFEKWLAEQGHDVYPPKGDWEKCRWQGNKGKPMPIIYDRIGSSEHYSCNEAAVPYVRRFIRDSKSN